MSTLLRVTGERRWTGKYGPMVSIGLLFSDDIGEFAAELNCKPESLDARLEALEPLIGSESGAWEFKSTGTWDDGKPKPRRVTSWPGKPEQSSGGGRSVGAAPAAWRNTEAGAKYEQERMDRRTALMQAIAWGSDRQVMSSILRSAEEAYAWLRESVSPPGGLSQPDGASQGRETTRGTSPPRGPGADTPSDEGGGIKYGSTVTASQESPPPSSSHAEKWTPAEACRCGQPWGGKTTASGKRLCLAGHVEKFDYV